VKFYDYFRSTAAYRVRIAANLKGLELDSVQVNLLEAEHHGAEYVGVNAQGLVPALASDAGVLTQSLAIIEYLDELHPQRPLLPVDLWQRAQQRSMAQVIACDVHPLNNLRVLGVLRKELAQPEAVAKQWMTRWMHAGFGALEALAGDGPYLGGAQPMLADLVLVPQLFNARRFSVAMDKFPRLIAIGENCAVLPEFSQAAPGWQG
jgi:maleylacetoacetate isomerase